MYDRYMCMCIFVKNKKKTRWVLLLDGLPPILFIVIFTVHILIITFTYCAMPV